MSRRSSTIAVAAALALPMAATPTGAAAPAMSPEAKRALRDAREAARLAGLPKLQPFVEVSEAPAGVLTPDQGSGQAARALFRSKFSVTSTWALLRGVPGGFAIGLARNGWGFDVSDQYNNNVWYFGNVAGSSATPVARCLWAQSSQTTRLASSVQVDCGPSRSLPESSYMQYSNGDFSSPADGTLTQVSQDCPVHANVQPWLPSTGTIGERMYNIPAGQWFRWRYMTKDGRFVLGRTPSTTPRTATTSANGTQDWGFAKAYCVPTVGPRHPPR